MKKELREIRKKISKKLWNYLNKELQVKYMVIWVALITLIALTVMLVHTQKRSVFVWWTTEESGLSNYCFEKKGEGMYCLVPKKVNQIEKSKEVIKWKK